MEKKLVLHFPNALVDKPIISNLVRKFDLEFNILKAYVTPEEEGNLILELIGTEENLTNAVKHLKGLGVKVQSLSKQVEMIEEKCTHCTACVPLCPAGAISVDRETFTVKFNSKKCIACGICIKVCPTKARILKI